MSNNRLFKRPKNWISRTLEGKFRKIKKLTIIKIRNVNSIIIRKHYGYCKTILERFWLYLEANRIISNIIRIFFRRRYARNIITKAHSSQRNNWEINSIKNRPLLDFDESHAGKNKSEDEADWNVGKRDDWRYSLVLAATLAGLDEVFQLAAAFS